MHYGRRRITRRAAFKSKVYSEVSMPFSLIPLLTNVHWCTDVPGEKIQHSHAYRYLGESFQNLTLIFWQKLISMDICLWSRNTFRSCDAWFIFLLTASSFFFFSNWFCARHTHCLPIFVALTWLRDTLEVHGEREEMSNTIKLVPKTTHKEMLTLRAPLNIAVTLAQQLPGINSVVITNGIDRPFREWLYQANKKSWEYIGVATFQLKLWSNIPRLPKSLQLNRQNQETNIISLHFRIVK